MSRAHTCDELGLCNSRHCNDVSACPDYDLAACNDRACQQHEVVSAKGLCHYKQPQRRFTDRPGCAREAYPQPTFPFAPGVIQGPGWAPGGFTQEDDRVWGALLRGQLAVVLIMLVVVASFFAARWWYVAR